VSPGVSGNSCQRALATLGAKALQRHEYFLDLPTLFSEVGKDLLHVSHSAHPFFRSGFLPGHRLRVGMSSR
jgi:hypothetical protein